MLFVCTRIIMIVRNCTQFIGSGMYVYMQFVSNTCMCIIHMQNACVYARSTLCEVGTSGVVMRSAKAKRSVWETRRESETKRQMHREKDRGTQERDRPAKNSADWRG